MDDEMLLDVPDDEELITEEDNSGDSVPEENEEESEDTMEQYETDITPAVNSDDNSGFLHYL